jgi:hypothetical protein
MAELNDNPSFGNFSIQDTMEMGLGNAELLNDLMAPETATAESEELTPIIKEAEDKKPIIPPVKGKEIVPKPEGEELTGQDLISNFLGDDDTKEEEEVPTPIKPTKEVEVKAEGEGEEPTGTQFSALANDLYKLGVFSKDEEDDEEAPINTPEEFLARFNEEKVKGAREVVNSFIGKFGEDYQRAFDAIFVKGVDPKEYFGAYNTITNFAELDMTVEDNQVAVIKQALADQGFEPEDIPTEIERLKNYGDLESVSAKYHKVLIKKGDSQLRQLEQKAEQELQNKAAVRTQWINSVQQILQEKLKTKEFDGIPINPKLANELQDFLLVDKYKTPSGETLTDFDKTILELKKPENHAMKVKLGLLLKIIEKDPTLATIQRTGITKKSEQLFGELTKQGAKGVTPKAATGKSSWFL